MTAMTRIDRSERVLLTGAAGRMGRAAARALVAAGWRVRGFDRLPAPGCTESVVGSIADGACVREAVRGTGVIIHLAATPDDGEFLEQLVPNNIVGLYHVFEAAREFGVRRFVLASSGQVNWWQQFDGPWPVRLEDPLTPRHWYAMTKVAAEAAGRSFARQFGMTVIALRLGWLPRTREQVEEIAGSEHGQDVYLSPTDAGRLYVRTLEAEVPPGFHPLYACGLPSFKRIFDLEPTRRLIGWEPTEKWPTDCEEDLNPPGFGPSPSPAGAGGAASS